MGFLSLNTVLNFLFADALISSPTHGDIYADVKMSENHTRKTDVTKHTLENGVKISDHAIIQPKEATITFAVTNTGWTNIIGTRAQEIFDKLEKISETQEPVTVTTEHKVYDNIILTNVRMLHSSPYKGSLQIACDMEQLNFAAYEVIKTQNVLSSLGGIDKSASSAVNAGKQQVKQTSGELKSFLSDFVS